MKLSNSNQLCVNDLLETTHKVERTRRTVRLTWTTMVMYWSVNVLIIWLRNINMQVGRVTWSKRDIYIVFCCSINWWLAI